MQILIRTVKTVHERLVAGHERSLEKLMGVAYAVGDLTIFLFAAFECGFFKTVANDAPDFGLLRKAYIEHPLPLLCALLFTYGNALLAQGRLKKGYWISTLGELIFLIDLAVQDEMASALMSLLTITGTLISAYHKDLFVHFGRYKNPWLAQTLGQPKRLGGLLLAASFIPLIFSSILESDPVVCFASINWSLGAIISMILPSAPLKKKIWHEKVRLQKDPALPVSMVPI